MNTNVLEDRMIRAFEANEPKTTGCFVYKIGKTTIKPDFDKRTIYISNSKGDAIISHSATVLASIDRFNRRHNNGRLQEIFTSILKEL